MLWHDHFKVLCEQIYEGKPTAHAARAVQEQQRFSLAAAKHADAATSDFLE